MDIKVEKFSYKKLCELKQEGFLQVNPEYQRGAVWNFRQQKMLIDSILRNYPIPVIYLHYREKSLGALKRCFYDIIDGQQRINAISNFMNDEFKLLNPKHPKVKNSFPDFIQKSETPWSNCLYSTLTDKYKNKFSNEEINVVVLETKDNNEVRDLFIRLQDGLPLNAQEKRDAWPGGFNKFVLKIGGKKDTKYNGHDFIQGCLYKTSTDRGNLRKLTAQLAMIYFENSKHDKFIDIGSKSIDNYYYKNLDLDSDSDLCKEFEGQLDFLYELFDDFKGPKLKGYEAIDILLLVKELRRNYTRSWEANFFEAFYSFREHLAIAKKAKEGDYWFQYSAHTRTSSDKAETIAKRHRFFLDKMIPILNPFKKDQNRIFNSIERQILYYRYKLKCAKCFESLDWDDMEIHHIRPYHEGGTTNLENGVPVHKACHPKSKADVLQFEKDFNSYKNNGIYDTLEATSSTKRKSPNVKDYINKVDDLKKYNNVSNWAQLCAVLNIDVGSDSARRRFEKWTKIYKPEWPTIE